MLDRFLKQVLLQIGLNSGDAFYDVRFKDSRVEMLYVVKKEKTIAHLGRKVNFLKGDIVLVAISYKYTKDTLNKNLKKFFRNVNVVTDREETYALAFCQK